MTTIWAQLPEAIEKIRTAGTGAAELLKFNEQPDSLNEAVFFLKPEVTSDRNVKLADVCEIARAAFEKFNVKVCSCTVFSGKYLEENNIMASHYGAINEVSRLGIKGLSDAARAKLESTYADALASGAKVLGGHQFLEQFPYFNAESLCVLWDSLNSTACVKLAPGTYAIRYSILGQDVIVLNGFHPYQLSFFTGASKCIAVMVVRSQTSWSELRNAMLGATDPTQAAAGSFRANLLARKDELGLNEVSKGLNGVHLSAGPVEGFFEVTRFFGNDVKPGTNLPAFLKAQGKNADDVLARASANPVITVGEKSVKLFDATEEINMAEAAALLA